MWVTFTDIETDEASKACFIAIGTVTYKPQTLMRDFVSDGMVGDWIEVQRESVYPALFLTAFNMQHLRFQELRARCKKGVL